MRGTVWFDGDRDGRQDTAEAGLAGRDVFLFHGTMAAGDLLPQELVAQTLTGVQGSYHFTNLPSGNYIVAVVPKAGETPTTATMVSFALSDAHLDHQVDFGLFYYQNPRYLPLMLSGF